MLCIVYNIDIKLLRGVDRMKVRDTIDITYKGKRGYQGDDWKIEKEDDERGEDEAPKIQSYTLESLIAYYRKNAVGEREKLYNTTAEMLFAYRELRTRLKAYNKDIKFADERVAGTLSEAIKSAKEAADDIAEKVSKKLAEKLKEEFSNEVGEDNKESEV